MAVTPAGPNHATPVSLLFPDGCPFVEASGWEQKRAELDFAQRADIMVQMLTDNLDRQLDVLYSMRGLYASSPQVDRQAFHSFAEVLLARHPGIQAL